jgi:hypothetical protein
MEHRCGTGLTDEQIAICAERVSKDSPHIYEAIMANHPGITPKKLIHGFNRLAMGYPWPADIKGGRLSYLCEEDSIELQNRIADAQKHLVPSAFLTS